MNKNTKNDVREDDVEKLAEYYAHNYFDMHDNNYQGILKGFKLGYNKAKENTYTEEQVRRAIYQGMMIEKFVEEETSDRYKGIEGREKQRRVEDYMQSLKKLK